MALSHHENIEKQIAEQEAKSQSIRQSDFNSLRQNDFDSPQRTNEKIRQAEFAAARDRAADASDNLHDMHNRLGNVIVRTNEFVENFTALLSAIDGKPPEVGEPQKNSSREGIGFVTVISEQIEFMASRLLILERLKGRLERVISG